MTQTDLVFWRMVLLVALIGGPGLPAEGGASKHLHPDLAVARKFAPIVWRAEDEPLVPTMPHAFAFDGLDNDLPRGTPNKRDLEDPAEISWSLTASVKDLAKAVKQSETKPRVLYRVQKDPKPFREVEKPKIYIIEYWFYYEYDRGVGAHKGDSEHTFVFVALDDRRMRTVADLEDAHVVGIVGAGHESHTANNILVTGSNADPAGEIFPSSLPNHIPILVERGKHASAPDRNFNGRFDKGVDVNIFRDGAWGSRDARADSVGRLVGPFRDWYSFPRNERTLILEEHFFDDDGYAEYRDSYPAQFPSPGPPENDFERYSLFPLEDLECLYQLLGYDGESSASSRCGESVEDFLNEHRDCFWTEVPNPEDPVIVSSEAEKQMRLWVDENAWRESPGGNKTKAHNLNLIEHEDHQDPEHIFKTHLHPTMSLGVGIKKDGASPLLLKPSVQFSEITWGHLQVLANSAIEIGASFYQKPIQFYDAEAHYWFFRGGYAGLYLGGSVRRERLSATSDITEDARDQLATSLGFDTTPGESVERPLGLQLVSVDVEKRMRWAVDAGAAVTFNLHSLCGRWCKNLFIDATGGLRADIFNQSPSDFERARGAQDKLRFVYSLSFRFGPFHGKHPLSY